RDAGTAVRDLRRLPPQALIAARLFLAERLPHAVRGRDRAFADDEFAAHEDERARAAHDTAAGLDELADLHRVDEMHVEVYRRLRLLVIRVPRGHSERAVREGHQHAALHHAAAVVMFLGGLECEQRRLPVALLLAPERTDEADEAFIRVRRPARRGGIERRLGVG